MMRLIDNDKTDAPRTRKAVAVNGQELGVVSTMPVRPEAKPANTSSRAASTVSPVSTPTPMPSAAIVDER